MRAKVLDAVMCCMNRVFKEIPEKEFEAEAEALLTKWTRENGSFGMEGMIEAVMWWQERATIDNAFPLTRN